MSRSEREGFNEQDTQAEEADDEVQAALEVLQDNREIAEDYDLYRGDDIRATRERGREFREGCLQWLLSNAD